VNAEAVLKQNAIQETTIHPVIPALAGIRCRNLHSRLRGNDKQSPFSVLT
jgi:hypothetical protein